jgi:hypothetical protein
MVLMEGNEDISANVLIIFIREILIYFFKFIGAFILLVEGYFKFVFFFLILKKDTLITLFNCLFSSSLYINEI